MHSSHTTIKTADGSRYIRMLCKHFAHKIPAHYSEWHGACAFPCGAAALLADESSLRFKVESPSAEELLQTQSVLESHLQQFARKENLQPLDWES